MCLYLNTLTDVIASVAKWLTRLKFENEKSSKFVGVHVVDRP